MYWVRLLFVTSFIMQGSALAQVELCDNGIDDDNDSLIDLNDDDCFCRLTKSTSLIPNPTFEDLDCCPDAKSQLYCATDWIQASTPTTDLIHLCGWSGIEEYPPPIPFPDGEGVLGFRDGRQSGSDTLDAYWKEYAGACLLSPMLADSFYRFRFDLGFVDPDISPPINVTVFGTTSCDYLPFNTGDAAFGCPANNPEWKELGAVFLSGGSGNSWVRAYVDINPDQDIHAIAIGPPCEPLFSSNVIYYYFDDLHLIDLASFDLQIEENLHPCDAAFTLAVAENTDFEYQWYLEGIALVEETNAKLKQNYGAGSYQVRILSGSSCRVSSPYNYNIPSFNSSDTLRICQEEIYTFGTQLLDKTGSYTETFITEDNCDSTVMLELEVIGSSYDTVEITLAPGQSLAYKGSNYSEEGEYNVVIPSSLGCDSIVLLLLTQYEVYIPNVFSPDNDGVNDTFRPYTDPDELRSYEMTIYDRWGNLLYRGKEWNGAKVGPDIYMYHIQVEFIHGERSNFYGSVMRL